jgi:hypothetical protein
MGVVQGSTLYGGSVSTAAIYRIMQGEGFKWKGFVKTEINVDRKPRQLTRAIHAGNPLQDDIANPVAADFEGNPSVTIDGRQLNVSEMSVRDTMSPQDFKETFPEYQPTGLSVDLKMNPVIQSAVLDLTMDAVENQVNEIHSAGDETLISPDPLRFYDGFTTLILADGDATQVGTPAVLSKANILAQVYELRNAVAPRLRSKSDLSIFCSPAAFDFYDEARRETQTQMATTDLGANDKLVQANNSKITLIPIEGMPTNFMFATIASTGDNSNLVQGVWVEKDIEALKVYKMTEGDKDWRLLLRFAMGVQYKSGKDIWYKNNI